MVAVSSKRTGGLQENGMTQFQESTHGLKLDMGIQRYSPSKPVMFPSLPDVV